VVDLGLPDGKGTEVLDSFRARCPSGALVVASGYVDEQLFERSEQDERMAILEKPFDGAALLDILVELGLHMGHPDAEAGKA
jgi:DNA-binding NarL/FixJ family response regulator